MKTIKTTIAILAMAIFAVSCSKPENGINGKDGTNGTNGAVGQTGTTGTTGSANVIYSTWTNIPLTAEGTYFVGEVIVPQITQEILDRGLILVYFEISTGSFSGVYQCNYFDPGFSPARYFVAYHRLAKIKLDTSISANQRIRYIIIPGGVPAGRGTTPRLDYKTMTYSQVCKSLNIPE